MTYIPHAALSAVKVLHGSVAQARVTLSSGKGIKYQVLCQVQVFGIPGTRTLKSVRYLGPLTLTVGAESRVSPPGYFDDLITWALQKNEPLDAVIAALERQLSGIAVSTQNLGGRWLIR